MQEDNQPRYEYGIKALAIIGVFTVLIGLGWGAVAVAQYVPGAVSGLVSAVVSITSDFFPADENGDTTTPTSTPATSTPPAATSTPTDPAPTPPTQPTEPTPGDRTDQVRQIPTDANGNTGPADLAASILAIGVIDADTQEFTATTTIRKSDRVGVRFQVENVGGERYDREWSFAAALPTTPAHVFSSDPQRPLNPGDRIEYTIGFDKIDTTDRKFVINIDPRDRLNDANDENNLASTTIELSN